MPVDNDDTIIDPQDLLPDISVPDFPAEPWLDAVPDYDAALGRLTWFLVAAAVVWFGLVPLMALAALDEERLEALEQAAASQDVEPLQAGRPQRQQADQQQQPPHVASFDWRQVVWVSLMGFFWTSLALVIQCSPYHQLLARGVLEVPGFLSAAECGALNERIQAAARRNVEALMGNDSDDGGSATQQPPDPFGYLQHPQGFNKRSPYNETVLVSELSFLDHHGSGGDGFDANDRAWLIHTILQPRLTPTLQRAYGIQHLQLQDLYVSRYQAGTKRTFSTIYEDQNDYRARYHIAFRIALTDDFTGGATQFWNRFQQRYFCDVLEHHDDKSSNVGTLIMNSNRLDHQDTHVRDGTRDLLMGTVAIVIPSSHKAKSPSWFSTYLNFAWLSTRLEQFIQTQYAQYHKVTRLALFAKLLLDLIDGAIGDTLLPHEHVRLITREDAPQFRQALMDANAVTAKTKTSSDTESTPSTINWLGSDEL